MQHATLDVESALPSPLGAPPLPKHASAPAPSALTVKEALAELGEARLIWHIQYVVAAYWKDPCL